MIMSAANITALQWASLDSFSDTQQTLLLQEIRAWIVKHPAATIDHDPDWLAVKSQAAGRATKLYVLYGADQVLYGYAPFFVHPSSFVFEYAAKTLMTLKTRRFAITAEPLLSDRVDALSTIPALLDMIASGLLRRDVLFGLGVPLESQFARALSAPSVQAKYLLMPHGPEYSRRLARLPESLDAYLALLGSKSRSDLRRHERRLAKAADEEVSVSVHDSPDTIPEFLRCAAQVSRLTYQSRVHGIGVGDDAESERHFCAIAARGWLRCYLLLAKGQPVAFMVGYLWRGVYYSETIGYDPAWADYSAGNVLHMNVVRDLTRLEPRVEWFDFMYGDNSNKERLSTDSRQERNYYLVPRTLRWSLLLAALRGFDTATDALNRILDRHGLKDRLKRWLRQRSREPK